MFSNLTDLLFNINDWLSKLLSGYWILMVLLLTFRITVHTRKEKLDSWINDANRVYAFIALIGMIGYLTEMGYGWFGPYDQDYKVFIGYRILGPWRAIFWMVFAGAFVLPQLYWLTKMRNQLPFILLVLTLMHADDITGWVSPSYRAYYSSWWNFGESGFGFSKYAALLLFPIATVIYRRFIKPG